MPEVEQEEVVRAMEAWLVEQKEAIALLKSVDADVLAAAIECFESPLSAGHFLISPARSLAEKIPVEVAQTPEGKKQVLTLIGAIEHGVYL